MKNIYLAKQLTLLFLYLLLAGISCWATAVSLNLTWPSVPIMVCYVIAIGFFFVASVGATMVVKAFVKGKFTKHRSRLLGSGITILLFFWIMVSLPTNSHTFLYQFKIADVLNEEQQTTNKYLKQIQLRSPTEQYINQSKVCEENINTWMASWEKGEVNINDSKDVRYDFNDRRLMPAYSLIKTCRSYVDFENKDDEQRYTSENLTSNISKIFSVYDLWYEFLFASYSGNLLMVICILISLFVDIAAFVIYIVFLNKAPKNTNVKVLKMQGESKSQLD